MPCRFTVIEDACVGLNKNRVRLPYGRHLRLLGALKLRVSSKCWPDNFLFCHDIITALLSCSVLSGGPSACQNVVAFIECNTGNIRDCKNGACVDGNAVELDVAGSVEIPRPVSCLPLFGREAFGNHVNLFVRKLVG